MSGEVIQTHLLLWRYDTPKLNEWLKEVCKNAPLLMIFVHNKSCKRLMIKIEIISVQSELTKLQQLSWYCSSTLWMIIWSLQEWSSEQSGYSKHMLKLTLKIESLNIIKLIEKVTTALKTRHPNPVSNFLSLQECSFD